VSFVSLGCHGYVAESYPLNLNQVMLAEGV